MTPGNDWLDQARRLVTGLGQALAAGPPPQGSDAGPEASAAHGSDCRWCPLCQAAGVLRGERPEVTAAIADALTAAAAALRTLAAEPPRTAPQAAPEEGTADGPGAPAVQHIEIA
ncbi:hypothetical protein [Blastococcus sp. URHD0036]|uniref:hypothetical protein n=1 Tax=Blastococcus sp. URHD0036 TaxID=1380356 RepID=UPI00068D495E|nr:hypothetical protein [Blastococcus sp. URHD0036]